MEVQQLLLALAASEEARASSDRSRASLEAAFLAERKKFLVSQLCLVEARAKFPRFTASEVASDSSPAIDRWSFGSKVYHDLVASFDSAIVAFLTAAVNRHALGACPAGADLPERSTVDPATGHMCDSVHRHANGMVASVMAALRDFTSGQNAVLSYIFAEETPHRDFLAALRRVAVLQERHYEGRSDLQSPDEVVVLLNELSNNSRLTADNQLVVLEYKVAEALCSAEPCVGERQGAGYASQKVMAKLLELDDISSLKTSPLYAWAIYSDSLTSSLIKVTVTFDDVAIESCRMPFLSTSLLPSGTIGRDGGFAGLALALAVIDSVRDDESRSRTTQLSLDFAGGSAGETAGLRATLLGRGAFARVMLIAPCTIVKCPVSLRMLQSRWTSRVATEQAALTIFSRRSEQCRHVPVLVGAYADSSRIPVPEAVSAAQAAAVAPFVSVLAADSLSPFAPLLMAQVSVGARKGVFPVLTLSPLCSSLVGACDDIRESNKLATICAIQAAVLALVLPVLSALSYARGCRVAHMDVAVRNVMLSEGNMNDGLILADSFSLTGFGSGASAGTSARVMSDAPTLNRGWDPARFLQDIDVACANLLHDADSPVLPQDHAVTPRAAPSAGTTQHLSVLAATSNNVVLIDWGQARAISAMGILMGEGSGKLPAAGVEAYQCLHLTRDVLHLLVPRLRLRLRRSDGGATAAAATSSDATAKLRVWLLSTESRFAALDENLRRYKPGPVCESPGPEAPSAASSCHSTSFHVVLELLGLMDLSHTTEGASFVTLSGSAGGCRPADIAKLQAESIGV
jgi:hypothetical protein